MITRYYINRLRSISALILFGYVFMHLGNHILGLISIDAMEAMRGIVTKITRHPIGTIILALSILIHFYIALRALYQKPFLSLARWQQLQLISGILMILLLIPHVVPVRTIFHGFNIDTTYPLVLKGMWLNANIVVRQFALLIITWLHVCLGLFFWLNTKSWYRKNFLWMYALAIIWPLLALIGFSQAGYQSLDYDIQVVNNPDIFQLINTIKTTLLWSVVGICLLMLLLKQIKQKISLDSTHCNIMIGSNQVKASAGQSILNSLRLAKVPHASVCGGRARCTTCRVRVNRKMDNLEPAGELENLALRRINASPDIRLACQAVLKGDVDITALLPADATMKLAQPKGGVSGEEKEVVAMFVDLRGSTNLAEYKLPYDVLFVLNEFFIQMSKSLDNTKGHYAQFAGDGLMALYGLDADLKSGCIDALQGALDMIKRLDALNQKMQHDLEHPLKIGIGLHCGEAIVGNMGPPKSPNYSAIGDNINIAARLEAQTKTLKCLVVVSKQLLEKANLNHDNLNPATVSIRGRNKEMDVYKINSSLELENLIQSRIEISMNDKEQQLGQTQHSR